MNFSILLRSLALLAFLGACGAVSVRGSDLISDEEDAREFMDELTKSYSNECNKEMLARWDYITDVENATAEQKADEASVKYAQFRTESAKQILKYDYNNFEDVALYREFRFQADLGVGSLDRSDLDRYQSLQSNMESIYGSATICPFEDPDCTSRLSLEPEIENILATSTNFEELKYVWEEWRVQTGQKMRDDYIKFVKLSNQAAANDGYANTGDFWLNGYTVTEKEASADIYGVSDAVEVLQKIDQADFKEIVETIWEDVFESLYKPLHAYVRKKLQDVYPNQIDCKKPLPANILGDMWAQDWTNIGKYVMPYPEEPDYDVTQAMEKEGWTIKKMRDSAEDFFTSIGLLEMTETFNKKSIFEEGDKTMICHASAEDFCKGPGNTDFRIKMCTEINMVDLITLHHEMGHIEYFIAYTKLNHVFREAANPGFHEAIGDLIALSVSTPLHMETTLGLKVESEAQNPNAEHQSINFLMRMALEKIAFLPFGYLIDKYRWGIFDGSITTENLNSAWWNLRRKYQGVVPPSFDFRGEEFFDAGAKYHVPANVPYIRYFVSFIAQFQFHKQLCTKAKHDGPLHECDIYGKGEAGNVLKAALEKGMSKPWPLILKDLGGSLNLDTQPIKNYFEPLIKFFEDNLDKDEIGWDEIPTTLMEEIDKNMTMYLQDVVQESWKYNTDMNDQNEKAMNDASVKFSQVYRSWWDQIISKVPYEELKDPALQRMYAMQQNIGTAILDEEDLTELNNNLNEMMDAYGATVCPFDDMNCSEDKAYDINRLEIEMATNRDYSQLLYYWEQWRDASGKKMINNFENYVRLMNKAANLNGFNDTSEMWIEPYTTYKLQNKDMPLYDDSHFRADIENLWGEVSEKYQLIHAYVRSKLKEGNNDYSMYINDDGLLPANILGNMWAQSWENIYDLVAPYPEISLIDITKDLEKNDNVEDMFKLAEKFFDGLNMFEMTEDFWENSMMSQPKDKKVVCHASAWDFYSDEINNQNNGKFRIKMCTNTNQEDFIVIHHEMGHIEYQMAYSNDLPLIFRDGANPGFHEAIGDTIALSVSTPSHLEKIEQSLNGGRSKKIKTKSNEGQIDDTYTKDEKRNINFLMKQALSKFVFLPYAYIMDQWRWEVFEGKITPDVYNKKWWDKRITYQGIRPPISRTDPQDFDIGSKFHIPANTPYMSYFVAHILQFQFHQKLCKIAKPKDKLFECDIENSKTAGKHFMKMLKKGASQHWQQQLAEFLETEDGNMDPKAILDYFQPLWDYLDKEVQDKIGWESGDDVLNNYVSSGENISALVPIIVGVVLVVLVCIVLIAFFVGRNKRKKKDAKRKESMHHERKHSVMEGKINDALEMEDQHSRI